MLTKEKLRAGARVLYLTVAGLEGWIFFGAAAVGFLISLHLAPTDPGPNGEMPDYGPWHASLGLLRQSLEISLFGLPALVGLLAVILESFPRREVAIPLAGLGMSAVVVFSVVFVWQGWALH